VPCVSASSMTSNKVPAEPIVHIGVDNVNIYLDTVHI
jgi:hypothetical protein